MPTPWPYAAKMPRFSIAFPANMPTKIKPELMQCYVEINTDVCKGVSDVEADLKPKLQVLSSAAAAENVQLYWSGTHPFSTWRDQKNHTQ